MSPTDQASQLEQVKASKAHRCVRKGFTTTDLPLVLVAGLLAIPGLKSLATTMSNMKTQ